MGRKKTTILIFVIFSRIFDTFSTYVSRNGDLSGEMNPLIRIFHLGWTSLIISNILGVIILSFFLYNQSDKYLEKAEIKIIHKMSFAEYIGIVYFGKKTSFLNSLTSKINYRVLLNTGIILILICTIIVSLIVGINNLLVSITINFLYSTNNFINKNIVNFINIFIFILVFIFYHHKRFTLLKKQNGN